jgi:hypothetical protein
MKSPKTKLVLALIAMFVFGAISGAGLTLFCHPPFFQPPRPEEMQKVMTGFFTRRLNLTPDQQEKLRPITVDFANQAATLHAQSINQLSQLATNKRSCWRSWPKSGTKTSKSTADLRGRDFEQPLWAKCR